MNSREDQLRVERLERLNRESWEVLQTARRLHDETAAALKAMFEATRSSDREQRSEGPAAP